MPAKSFALIGSYSVAAWVLCAAIMGAVAACFAEVGSRFAQTGGPYLYAHAAFGPAVGFIVGWLSWISRLFSFATIANLEVTHAGAFAPTLMTGVPRVACIIVITALLTALVLLGVRWAAYINNALTTCKLVLLIGFTLVCLPSMHLSSLVAHPVTTTAADWRAAIMLMSFAFLGIESAMITTGEMKNPRADVPFALGTGLAVIALLYVAIQIACIGSVPSLATSARPIVDAAEHALGTTGAVIVNIGALVTLLGTLFAVLLTGSRLPFAFAEQGQLPHWLASVHDRWRTPYASIVVTGFCAGALALYSSFLGALIVTALTRLLGYLTTCAALIAFRIEKGPTQRPGFNLPGGVWVALAGIAACGWLMLGSSRSELFSVLSTILGGAAVAGLDALCRRCCGRRYRSVRR